MSQWPWYWERSQWLLVGRYIALIVATLYFFSFAGSLVSFGVKFKIFIAFSYSFSFWRSIVAFQREVLFENVWFYSSTLRVDNVWTMRERDYFAERFRDASVDGACYCIRKAHKNHVICFFSIAFNPMATFIKWLINGFLKPKFS